MDVLKIFFLFSDGSSSQFKNKFIIDSLTNFIAEFECDTIEWNYFASSHGKGAVDGVGAVLKRKVWQMTKTKKLLLHNAFDFYECAKNHVSGIRIMYVEEGEIVISSILKTKWEQSPNVPGIRKIHHVSCDEHFKIQVAQTAYSKKNFIS